MPPAPLSDVVWSVSSPQPLKLGVRYSWQATVSSTAVLQHFRASVPAGTIGPGSPYLDVPGLCDNSASTPDSVKNSIRGNLDIRAAIRLEDWTPEGGANAFTKKSGSSASYQFFVSGDGDLVLGISTNGKTSVNRTSTEAVGASNGQLLAVRTTLDVDNGSGDNVVRFFTKSVDPTTARAEVSDNGGWTSLGSTVRDDGTIRIADGKSALRVGEHSCAHPDSLDMYYGEVRNGINGAPVAVVDPSDAWDTSETWESRITGTVSKLTAAVPNGTTGAAGTRYAYSPGLNLNYFSAPDNLAMSVTGDIDIRVKLAPDLWTPAAVSTLASKWLSAGDQRSFLFVLNPSGGLGLQLSDNGISTAFDVSSGAPLGFGAASTHWVRATWRQSDGRVQFFHSDDGSSWTQNGTDKSIVIASIFDSNASLTYGTRSSGSTEPLRGKVFFSEVRNGIDGTVVARFDPSEKTDFDTTWTSSTGEPWTVNRSGADSADLRSDLTVSERYGIGAGSAFLSYVDGTAVFKATAPASIASGTSLLLGLDGFPTPRQRAATPPTSRRMTMPAPRRSLTDRLRPTPSRSTTTRLT